ncbi:MAG: leucine-rich repeat domain-containing protein [Oscillospiraceae bacterium]|nr:leucine-rich repeat domain-containing protein [Oscillospiraceae bacterium]
MSYNVDRLFRFEKTEGGYVLATYIKKGNREIEIPAEYNGLPVVCIGNGVFEDAIDIERVVIPNTVTKIEDRAFSYATRLKSVELPNSVSEIGDQAFDCCLSLTDINIPKSVVRIGGDAFSTTRIKSAVLPKSLEVLDEGAFSCCFDLESVTFDSVPRFGQRVFFGCAKLPADITLMGLVNSFDITNPLDADAYNTNFKINWSVENQYEHNIYTRPDVFKLAIKNDCFRSVDVSVLLRFLIEAGFTERLIYAEKHGMLDDSALLDELTEYSVRQNKPEITAFLLDCKRRKFGYDSEDHYEL